MKSNFNTNPIEISGNLGLTSSCSGGDCSIATWEREGEHGESICTDIYTQVPSSGTYELGDQAREPQIMRL